MDDLYGYVEEIKEEERICEVEGKICYTERRAGEILNSTKRHNYSSRKKGVKPLRKYYCIHCKSYHITSVPWFREYRIERQSARKRRKMKYGY